MMFPWRLRGNLTVITVFNNNKNDHHNHYTEPAEPNRLKGLAPNWYNKAVCIARAGT